MLALADSTSGTISSANRALAPRRPLAEVTYEPGACICGARLPLGVRLGLRSRTRPVLEGRWCCGDKCLEARVAAAVKRETRKGSADKAHRHRLPLGLVLLSTGSVSHEDLRCALTRHHATGERIGDVLLREFGLSERKVAEALAVQWGCSVWDVRGVQPQTMARVAPRAVLERSSMLPLRIGRDGRLGVAFSHGLDAQAIFAMQRIHGRPVDAGLAPVSAWNEAQDRVLHAGGVPAEEITCADMADLQREAVKTLKKAQPVESRWARVHDLFWLRMWLEPAALPGGPAQAEDVCDAIFRLPIREG